MSTFVAHYPIIIVSLSILKLYAKNQKLFTKWDPLHTYKPFIFTVNGISCAFSFFLHAKWILSSYLNSFLQLIVKRVLRWILSYSICCDGRGPVYNVCTRSVPSFDHFRSNLYILLLFKRVLQSMYESFPWLNQCSCIYVAYKAGKVQKTSNDIWLLVLLLMVYAELMLSNFKIWYFTSKMDQLNCYVQKCMADLRCMRQNGCLHFMDS